MKRLGYALFGMMLLAGPAFAVPCSSYPNTLTNGTTADANQVMANFNTILLCANTALTPSASPTFTGTVTLPDGSTWSSGGLILDGGVTATGQVILGGTFTSPTLNTPILNTATIVTPSISGIATEPDASTWSSGGLLGLTKLYLGYMTDHGGGQTLQSSGNAFFAGSTGVTIGANSGNGFGQFRSDATNGAIVEGKGSSFDYLLQNGGGVTTCTVATGTTTLNCVGLSIGGVPVASAPYLSSQTALQSAGTTITFAHGLGSVPAFVEVYAVNQTGENGFTPGQQTQIFFNATFSPIWSISKDVTNVYVTFINFGSAQDVFNPSTGSPGTINPSNWKFVVNASK